ncbi:MAG: TraC family protein [Hyphomonadaceae bacterium]|nr:TraC family protein [Aquidulcibacter sp.]
MGFFDKFKTKTNHPEVPVEVFVKDVDRGQFIKAQVGGGPLDGVLGMIGAPFDTEAQEARSSGSGDISYLSAFLPYSSWLSDERLFVCAMGGEAGALGTKESVGFVLDCQPMTGCSPDQARVFEQFLGSQAPDESDIQIILTSLPKVAGALTRWRTTRDDERFPLLGRMAERRIELLNDIALGCGERGGALSVRDYRMVICLSVAGATDRASVSRLADCQRSLIQSLRDMMIVAEPMGPADLMAFVRDVLEPARDSRPAPVVDPGMVSLRQLVSNLDVRVSAEKEDRLQIVNRRSGNARVGASRKTDSEWFDETWEARVLFAKKFPPSAYQGSMGLLLGDPLTAGTPIEFPFVTSLSFHIHGRAKSTTKAEMSAMRAAQAAGPEWTRSFREIGEKADDWTYARAAVADGARLVDLMYCVTVFAPDGLGEKAENQIRGIYAQNSWELQSTAPVHQNALFNCIPLTWSTGLHTDMKAFGFLRTMTTIQAVHLAPMQAERGPVGSPIVMGVQRRGGLAYFDPFSNRGDGNHNVAIWGASGSGKSFFMQDLVSSSVGAGLQVTVIDQGRSFLGMTEALGGEQVELSPGKVLNLNPFAWFVAEARRDGEFETEMRSATELIIQQMAWGNATPERDRLGLLKEAIGAVWVEDGEDGSIERVAHWLKTNGGSDGTLLVRQLAAFHGHGNYARIFNGKETREFRNPLTTFEFGELSGQPDLRAVVMLAVLAVVRARMRAGGRDQAKLLVIDEGWQLLGDGAAAEFIEMMARTVRKENGALVAATQSIEDFYRTTAARAAFENSDWKVMLRQSAESIDAMVGQSRLALSAYESLLVKSLTVRKGQFSEFYVRGPNQKTLMRLVVDDLSAVLFSTDPDTFVSVRRQIEQGRGYPEVLEEMARRKADERQATLGGSGVDADAVMFELGKRLRSGEDIVQALSRLASEVSINKKRRRRG